MCLAAESSIRYGIGLWSFGRNSTEWFVCTWQILYLCFGTQQVVQPDCIGLEKHVDVYLDGVLVDPLPEVQSIVCLNIDSWGAGVKLWGMDS